MREFRCLFLAIGLLWLGALVRGVTSPEDNKSAGRDDLEADETTSDGAERRPGVFQPTSEWQPIPKDQAVPRGVHVRLNLQTGKREAKLVDPNEEEALADRGEKRALEDYRRDDNSRGSTHDQAAPISPEQLKHILHKMEGNERVRADEDTARVKQKFRSYEELKKELHNLQAAVKTDLEIMNDLMDTYKTIIKKRAKMSLSEFKESQEEEMNILTDLEFLVHQIDNAQEFVKNGLTDVVFPSLNSTSSKVRYEATKLLGSAVQSNPTAQITALELGTVSVLLRSLSIDASPQVKSGALYALSCLVRRFPAAQARLVERGGLTVFSKIFQSETGDILKLQVKVVTFVNDLILEKRDTEREVLASSNKSEEHMTEARERLRQYNTIGLERRLKGEGWCKLLIKLLQLQDVHREDSLEEELRLLREGTGGLRPEHDNIERICSAMASLATSCHSEFSQVRPLLGKLAARYAALAAAEHDELGYFTLISEQIGNLTLALSPSIHTLKEEL